MIYNIALLLLVAAVSGAVGFCLGRQDAPPVFLNLVCPDWRKIVGLYPRGNIDYSVPYRRWLAEQPRDYRLEIESTWSQRVVWKSIRAFRAATASIQPIKG